MSTVRYILGDMRTGRILDEVALQGVTMSNKLNGWGVFNGTTQLDQSGRSNVDILNAIESGKCFLVCERDDVPVWDGVVWADTYQSQAKTMQISGRTIEGYADCVFVKSDLTYTDTEQRNIFRSLWNTMQADPLSNIRVNVPSSYPNSVLKTLNVSASEFKTFLQVMSSVSDGADGFDWTVTTTKTSSGAYSRNLMIGYPFLGITGTGLTFDYPGQIVNYYSTRSMAGAGTHIYVLGAGEGSAMVVGTFANTDLTDNTWLRYDVAIPRKDIQDQSLVNAYAAQQGSVRKAPKTNIKAFLKDNVDPVFGSYNLGDNAVLSIIDPRYPDGSTFQARITALRYTPPSSSGTGEVELVFEGDELNV
jgi:hypothetical protein